jgi:FAD/FMN-containing dehydrogenase
MTIDHVDSVEVVLSDGSRASFGPTSPSAIAERATADSLEGKLYREIPPLIERSAEAIRRDMPPHWRRSGGYRMERVLPEGGPLNLANLVVGSEGTLAVTVEATVRLVPRPLAISALVGHFDSVSSAIRASDSAMECGAMAVELMDRNIIELARQSSVYGHLAKALVGDPGSILWVEFYGDTPAEAAVGMERLHKRWSELGHGYAIVPAPTPKEQKGFQELRKAGQALLMLAGGPTERSLAFVEDTAVDPSELIAYSETFSKLLEKYGMRA